MEGNMESAITVKGQATIPKSIREHLGLQPGDRIKFFVHPDGSVVLLPKISASAVRGIVKSRSPRPVTTEQMTIGAGIICRRADCRAWSAGRVYAHVDVRPKGDPASRLRTCVIEPDLAQCFPPRCHHN